LLRGAAAHVRRLQWPADALGAADGGDDPPAARRRDPRLRLRHARPWPEWRTLPAPPPSPSRPRWTRARSRSASSVWHTTLSLR